MARVLSGKGTAAADRRLAVRIDKWLSRPMKED